MDDAPAAAALVIAYERSLYRETAYSLSDLEAEWEPLDLAHDALVLLDGDRLVAFGSLDARGELCRIDGYVHPDAQGRGAGAQLVALLEQNALARGARRLQCGVVEADEAGQRLLGQLGYHPVRVFRELRIELTAAPEQPTWPEGLVSEEFDRDRDAAAFHAAEQEAFGDHWEFQPRDLARWSAIHVETERFEPKLWRIVRAGDEVAGGVICEADRYGGGWVSVLFTRRPWRGQGVGRALLLEAFGALWKRGESSVGLGVDAENPTGAFHLYESVGMRSVMGWVMHERDVQR